MATHNCNQADNIKSIKDKVDTLCQCVPVLEKEVEDMSKILNDNGHQGLKTTVTILSENVYRLGVQIDESKQDRKDLRNSIGELINYRSTLETTFLERDRANSEKEVRKAHVRWLLGLLIASAIAIATLFVSVRKESVKVQNLQEQLIDK